MKFNSPVKDFLYRLRGKKGNLTQQMYYQTSIVSTVYFNYKSTSHVALNALCKRESSPPHKQIMEDRIIEEGTLLSYVASSYRAFDVKVNLKPGVEDTHALRKTYITVGT